MLARIVRVSISTFDNDGYEVTEDFSVSSRRDEKANILWVGFGLR